MTFGLCCGPAEIEIALKSGFDYVELPLAQLASEADRAAYRGVPIGATNVFFPPLMRLFGPESTPWAPYAKDALEVAADLNVAIAVLGSGGQRRAPVKDESKTVRAHGEPEWERAFAEDAKKIAEMGQRLGVVVAPESLNRSETNVGNDLASLARMLNERDVRYTADSYHVLYEWRADHPGEDYPSDAHWAEQLPFSPVHVHVATLPRNAPEPDDPLLKGFVARLKELGYDSKVSLEANRGSSIEELKVANEKLRALFGR